jgi:hypothetical protein
MRTILTGDQTRLRLSESGGSILLSCADFSHTAAERLHLEDDADDEPGNTVDHARVTGGPVAELTRQRTPLPGKS